jgi:Na+-translocating ferredoxin:NAD+ oxidoreductase RnfD subunit
MVPQYVWFFGWSVLLAVMLFFPVSKLVWTLSVRRQERKRKRKLDDAELSGQMQRARFITFFLVVVFALMFNANIFGFPGAK